MNVLQGLIIFKRMRLGAKKKKLTLNLGKYLPSFGETQLVLRLLIVSHIKKCWHLIGTLSINLNTETA